MNGALSVKDGRGSYVPMEMWPLKGDPLPKNKNGWLILLDEINSAPNLTQAAAYKVVYDKMVGMNMLHEKCILGAAGNLITDGAIVNRLGTAMQSRMIHLVIHADARQWSSWASKNQLATEVISFINFQPDLLHKFNPDHDDFTFACPRTWHFVSDLVKKHGFDNVGLPLLVGTVGEGAAIEFHTYTEVYQQLPTMNNIINDPKGAGIPNDPAAQSAVAGMIGTYTDDKNIDKVIHYVDRMGIEFQTFAIRDLVNRNPAMVTNQYVDQWLNVNGEHFA
jgi:hypothetical protein